MRSVTRLVRFVVSMVLWLFSMLVAASVGFSWLLFEEMALSRFLRLISRFRNFMLCSLLAVLYAKYLRERIFC